MISCAGSGESPITEPRYFASVVDFMATPFLKRMLNDIPYVLVWVLTYNRFYGYW